MAIPGHWPLFTVWLGLSYYLARKDVFSLPSGKLSVLFVSISGNVCPYTNSKKNIRRVPWCKVTINIYFDGPLGCCPPYYTEPQQIGHLG